MNITPDLFYAFLKCPTKCWLRAAGEPPGGNPYAEWVRSQTESYRTTETGRLVGGSPSAEVAASPAPENLKAAKWRLATSLPVRAEINSCLVEASIHAIERAPAEGRGKAAQFVPIRFIFTNKLAKDDKLLLAFDALVLSAALGRAIPAGKIIHGDDHEFEFDGFCGTDYKRIPNVWRLQVMGESYIHAVTVTVDPSSPGVFGFRPLIVLENGPY